MSCFGIAQLGSRGRRIGPIEKELSSFRVLLGEHLAGHRERVLHYAADILVDEAMRKLRQREGRPVPGVSELVLANLLLPVI